MFGAVASPLVLVLLVLLVEMWFFWVECLNT